MIVQVNNPSLVDIPQTQLAVNQASGVGTLYVKNTTGFQSNWGVQVGNTGKEQSEVILLSSGAVSGTNLVLAANTAFNHPADTPVYAIKYNQVVFAKSTAGTSGTATPISNGTVTIQADQGFTQFDDTSGAVTDAYRTYFLNSATNGSTSFSDWITSAGFSFYSLAKIRERIKNKMFDASFIKDETIFDDWINEWKDQMANAVNSVNEDYSLGTVDVAFGTAGLGTVTTGDFKTVRRVWITTDGSSFVQSMKMNINDFLPDQQFSASHPYHAWLGDNIIQVKPDGNAGTARLVFYRFGTTMVNDTDELPSPMRSYTDSFVNYGLAQALLMDNKPDQYNMKLREALAVKNQFVNDIAARDKSGATYISLVETLEGNDSQW